MISTITKNEYNEFHTLRIEYPEPDSYVVSYIELTLEEAKQMEKEILKEEQEE